MSSVGLSGLSNISTDALQTRYEKALKQINKLIEINRQLKESGNEKDNEISELHSQIQTLHQTVRQLDEQNNILESKYMELEGHYREIEGYCKQLQEKMENNHSDGKEYQQKLRDYEERFHQQLQSKNVKYNELAREAEILHHVYDQTLASMKAHQERSKTLHQQVRLLQQQNIKLQKDNKRLMEDMKQNCNEELRRKLQQANSTIQKLMRQCSELRNRQIDFQVLQQRQKVERYLGFSLVNDPRQNDAVKQLIHEYHKKIYSLQSDRKEIQGKYKNLKHKLHSSSSENYQIKIQKLERLTEKQQLEIAKLIETYDKEINYMFKQNIKLKEGLYSLSYRYKQKSLDLQQKEKQLSELKVSTQRVSFENQSLKKFNHSLIEAKTIPFRDFSYLKKDFPHSQSLTMIEKRQSEDKLAQTKQNTTIETLEAPNLGLYSVQQKSRPDSKASENMQSQEKVLSASKYPNYSESDFRFIQSVNFINGYNVNLGENAHHLKK